jgi:cytochrome b561
MAADNIHALFGSLLLVIVVARLLRDVRRFPPVRAADVRSLIRRLSRMVYLLLYLAAGLQQLIGRGSSADLQVILLYGLITLIVIRVLAIGIWLRNRSRRRPIAAAAP